ncbi:MAG TPA: hypothetical protein VNS19_05050 [Acidimicrobiales bacterium]|nr:hypothetical protein [Acidimicrobiales bacterium]
MTLTVNFTGTVTGVSWFRATYPTAPTANVDTGVTTTATSSTISIPRNQTVDQLYNVRIKGPYGQVTSDTVRVTIGSAPTASAATVPVAEIGHPVVFSSTVTGTAVTTQWERSDDGGSTWSAVGSPMSGAGVRSYTLADPQPSDDGALFRAVASSLVGTASSTPVTLQVVPLIVAPTLTSTPDPLEVLTLGDSTLTATATGYNTVIQWYRYTPCPYTPGPSNPLACFGWNPWASPLAYGPSLDLWPTGLLTECATTQMRVVAVNGKGSVTYSFNVRKESAAPTPQTNIVDTQRYKPGVGMVPDTGTAGCASSSRLERLGSGGWELVTPGNFTLTTAESGAQFRRVFSNAVGEAASLTVTMVPAAVPGFEFQPVSTTAPLGSTVTFSAGEPIPGVGYRWETRAGGSTGSFTTVAGLRTTPGSNTPTLTWTVRDGDQGREFRLRAIESYNEGTSTGYDVLYTDTVTLTFAQAPVFTLQPVSTAGPAGTDGVLTVTASGTPAPAITWERSSDGETWSPVAGASGTTLTVPRTSTATSGQRYRAVATNVAGSVASDAAVVWVQAPQTIAFGALPTSPPSGSSVVLAATASSGLPVTYAAAGGCTVAGSTLQFSGVGQTCTVTASQAGSSSWTAAPPVSRATTVGRAVQTITFGALPTAPAVGTRTTLAATSDSGLAVYYVATGGCTVSDSSLTWTATVPCTVTARQNGTGQFLPAVPVERTTTAVVGDQTISLAPIPATLRTGDTFAFWAVATSKLPVSLSATGSCTLEGTTLKINSGGLCTVTGTQPGNADWNPAPAQTSSRTIRTDQTITFAELPTAPAVGTRTTLAATSDSGLPVYFGTTGGCTVSGTTVTWTATAPCTVTAYQNGTPDYFPAPPVSRTTTPI